MFEDISKENMSLKFIIWSKYSSFLTDPPYACDIKVSRDVFVSEFFADSWADDYGSFQ